MGCYIGADKFEDGCTLVDGTKMMSVKDIVKELLAKRAELTVLQDRINKGILLVEQSKGHKGLTNKDLILQDAVHALKGEPDTEYTSYHAAQKAKPLPGHKPTVHNTHCCPIHGCKYGNDDCPIETGTDETHYPYNNGCESCEYEQRT